MIPRNPYTLLRACVYAYLTASLALQSYGYAPSVGFARSKSAPAENPGGFEGAQITHAAAGEGGCLFDVPPSDPLACQSVFVPLYTTITASTATPITTLTQKPDPDPEPEPGDDDTPPGDGEDLLPTTSKHPRRVVGGVILLSSVLFIVLIFLIYHPPRRVISLLSLRVPPNLKPNLNLKSPHPSLVLPNARTLLNKLKSLKSLKPSGGGAYTPLGTDESTLIRWASEYDDIELFNDPADLNAEVDDMINAYGDAESIPLTSASASAARRGVSVGVDAEAGRNLKSGSRAVRNYGSAGVSPGPGGWFR